MEAYLYETDVYGNSFSKKQKKLYIPNIGVIVYSEKFDFNFASDEKDEILEAEKALKSGRCKKVEISHYFAKDVKGILSFCKTSNSARKKAEEMALGLAGIIKKY